MATPWTSLTEETNAVSSRGRARELFYELGHVLESLWTIYEAMLRGTPVPDSDNVLSRIEEALLRVSTRQSDRISAGS